MSKVKVLALWDADAGVFSARSDDVRGFNVEAETMPELIREIENMLPEMMRENGMEVGSEVDYEIDAQYHGVAHALEA
ncbi:DUF1902 domain-containing protein [Burkholderia ubonensis]|uniref:DUF1902 domain-containing protein n=1 Tax=Burkholderia ubonensis TaxID=101571 RepID=UPI0007563977|nr:DUF1902 domain-containing protein [Burkholderia ubonensis]KWN75272.1 hypothetical protein WM23_25900 [Burkholderia ubonensis]